ncbi:MAG: hypothetical protein ACI8QC_003888 [Planctomycetota bacterium]
MQLTNSPGTRRWVVEAFAAGNLAFLAVDIWFAHSMNDFAHWAEWIPFGFSILAPLMLLPGILSGRPQQGAARRLGLFAGGASAMVGIAGLLYHLHGTFFLEQTIHNLVYTAPFAAPLAYTGLGFLLLINRLEDPAGASYGQWVTLMAAGGFAGNFALTLADHAQNGFFHASEWIAVMSAAMGLGFLLTACWANHELRMLKAAAAIMGVQALVGLLGAGLHVRAILAGPSESFLDNAIHTAPLFAPMLFVDLAILGLLGLGCSASTLATSSTKEH